MLLALCMGLVSDAAAQPIDVGDLGTVLGNPDAPVQVVEFSDLSCPYCAEFHKETFPTLVEEYVETGKIQWVFVTYVSGLYPNSLAAGTTAECAGEQGQYQAMVSALYEARDGWVRAGMSTAGGVFTGLAEELGLDMEAFLACARDEAKAERVLSATPLSREHGVRGTPTFVIDGFPAMGALPIDFIRRMLDRRIEEVTGGVPDSPGH